VSSVSPYLQLPIRSLDEARKEIDAKRSANHPNQPLQPFLQAPRRYFDAGLVSGRCAELTGRYTAILHLCCAAAAGHTSVEFERMMI